jgi:ketosteroid isomerase-like protein
MQSWLAAKILRRNMRLLNAGNPKPTLRLDSRKVEFSFPGRSSWSGTFRGKKALRTWLERFCATGLQIFADEVVVKGFPWRQTVCVRGTDHLDTPDGRVYENRYVIWGHMRWGRLRRYEVYEDTEKSTALDDWMTRVGHPGAALAEPGGGFRRRRRPWT